MAIGASNLTHNATATAATSFVTASVSPGANELILLTVGSRSAATNNTPTATGAGMTWTLVSSQINALNTNRVTVFRAMSASPGSGAVTIDFAGQSQTACLWSIDDFTGTDTSGSNGAGAIVQTVSGLVTGSSTGGTVNLAALGSSNNAAFGGCHRNNNSLLTAGSGFTVLSPGDTVGGSQHTEWQLTVTAVNWSWPSGSSDVEMMAIEIKADVPANFGWLDSVPIIRKPRRPIGADETAVPSTFVPKMVTGLSLWFDAADASTITSSAGAVSQWRDKSTTAIVASQGTGSAQPTVSVADQNGLNTITFLAANAQVLTFSASVNVDTDYTLFSVFKRTNSSSEVNAIAYSVGGTNAFGNVYYTDNNIYISNSTGFYNGVAPNNTTYDLVTSQLTSSTGAARFNFNPVSLAFTAGSGRSAIFDNIGARGGAVPVNGSIAEVILYNRVLSATEIAIVENYLQAKWATPAASVAPNFGWNTCDETAPRKRRFRQLDEVVQAPSSANLPPQPRTIGWDAPDIPGPRRKKFRTLEESVGPVFPPAAAPTAPPTGWQTQEDPRPRRKKFRQLDETVQPLRTTAGGPLGPDDLTDTTGAILTDVAGVHITDVPASVVSTFWQALDDTAPRKRKYRQLDEGVLAPSPFGLPAPPFGWNATDAPTKRIRRSARPGEVVETLFVSAPAVTPSTFWLTDDETQPRRRRYRQLDEVTAPIFPPPFIATTPSAMWMTQDETAPRKRRSRSLDEVVKPLFPPAVPITTPSTMWMTADDTATRKRKYNRQLDEIVQPFQQAYDFLSFGMWFIGADGSISSSFAQVEQPRRRKYRQLPNDETVLRPVAAPLGPGVLTDTLGVGLTDVGGTLLTDVSAGAATPSAFWLTDDETAPRRRRYRQLDAVTQAPSPFGLPPIVNPPTTMWMAMEEPRPRRRRYRQLDETVGVISALGLPAVVAGNFGWNANDAPWRFRRKYRQLDEIVIPLRLPPGLPVPVPPPTPDPCAERKSLLGPFVFGPNTPQLGDLAVAVLQDLGIQESGQPIAAEDANTIIGRLFPKLEELNERDVAYIDADNIANAQFLPLVKIMAWECASAFSITDPAKLAQLQAKGAQGGEAEGALKDIVRLRTPRQVLRNEIFTRNPYGRRWW